MFKGGGEHIHRYSHRYIHRYIHMYTHWQIDKHAFKHVLVPGMDCCDCQRPDMQGQCVECFCPTGCCAWLASSGGVKGTPSDSSTRCLTCGRSSASARGASQSPLSTSSLWCTGLHVSSGGPSGFRTTLQASHWSGRVEGACPDQ